ncbi:DUF3883 domain-containing protein [Chloracidobacterium sp. MS 40/45]|nr:DUF3883 domain-containing protein [Chloracidobacterium sp. D]QUW01839.1 DUF3883 domain-containing protein [Chloracidobacterium sp. MS 40/45]
MRSRIPSTEEEQVESVRHIEVKARATTSAIAHTPNEWPMAQCPGNDYTSSGRRQPGRCSISCSTW